MSKCMSGARVAAWCAVVAFVVAFGLAGLARAEDAQDVRGNYHGCADLTLGPSWTALTSASLEDSKGSAALSGSLYWTELMVKTPSDTVYVCMTGAASCGEDGADKLSVGSGGTLVIPLRGLLVQTVSLYGTSSSPTVQVCGYFRKGG